MFHSDWLILHILHQSFEVERPKGHWSEVVVHLYIFANLVVAWLYYELFFNQSVQLSRRKKMFFAGKRWQKIS